MMIELIACGYDKGYVAGANDGIATINGIAKACKIYALDTNNLNVLMVATALPNGHYLIPNLNPNKRYLILARDNVVNRMRQFEPCAYDDITPASNLNLNEQAILWQSWQLPQT